MTLLLSFLLVAIAAALIIIALLQHTRVYSRTLLRASTVIGSIGVVIFALVLLFSEPISSAEQRFSGFFQERKEEKKLTTQAGREIVQQAKTHYPALESVVDFEQKQIRYLFNRDASYYLVVPFDEQKNASLYCTRQAQSEAEVDTIIFEEHSDHDILEALKTQQCL